MDGGLVLPPPAGYVLESGGLMTVSRCPEHGDLMLELARGGFDNHEWLRAEAAREECADCARWWNEAYSGEAYDAVDGAVAEAISSFVPPAGRRYRLLMAAAALVLAIGIGAISMQRRDAQTSPAYASDIVSTFDFETGTLDEAVAAAGEASHGFDEANGKPAVFAGGFESGDLSSWATNS
jgi:hypothetical protein